MHISLMRGSKLDEARRELSSAASHASSAVGYCNLTTSGAESARSAATWALSDVRDAIDLLRDGGHSTSAAESAASALRSGLGHISDYLSRPKDTNECGDAQNAFSNALSDIRRAISGL